MKIFKIFLSICFCSVFAVCGNPNPNEGEKKDSKLQNIPEQRTTEEFTKSLEGKSESEIKSIIEDLKRDKNNVSDDQKTTTNITDKISVANQYINKKLTEESEAQLENQDKEKDDIIKAIELKANEKLDNKSKMIFQNKLKAFNNTQKGFTNTFKTKIKKLNEDLNVEVLEKKLKNETNKLKFIQAEIEKTNSEISSGQNELKTELPKQISKNKTDFDEKIKITQNINDIEDLLNIAAVILKNKKSAVFLEAEISIKQNYVNNVLKNIKNKYQNINTTKQDKEKPKNQQANVSNDQDDKNDEIDDEDWGDESNFNAPKWEMPKNLIPVGFSNKNIPKQNISSTTPNPEYEIQKQISQKISNESFKEAEQLLRKHKNLPIEFIYKIFNWAVKSDKKDIVKCLFDNYKTSLHNASTALTWSVKNKNVSMSILILENAENIDKFGLGSTLLQLAQYKDGKPGIDKILEKYKSKIKEIDLHNIILKLLEIYDYDYANKFIRTSIKNDATFDPYQILIKLLEKDKFDLFKFIFDSLHKELDEGSFYRLFEKVLFSDKSDDYFNLLSKHLIKISESLYPGLLASSRLHKNIDRSVRFIDSIKIKFSKEDLSSFIISAFVSSSNEKSIKISNALLRYNLRNNKIIILDELKDKAKLYNLKLNEKGDKVEKIK